MKPSMLARKLRQEFWPTAQMRELTRWNADGGDELMRFCYRDVGPDSLILDVGGYHGQWTSDMVARYGCMALAIEPVPAFAAFIRARFVRNPRILVREFALGAANGTLRLDQDGVYSSQFCASPSVEAEVIDAAEFFRSSIPANLDVMSVNCEGGEYDLLPRLIESGQIAKVQELEIQFHDFVPDAIQKRRMIRRGLAKTHHEIYSYPFVWEHWRRK